MMTNNTTASSQLPSYRPLSDLRNEYWMIQKLGCGGFGKVYLIRNRESRSYCAAKHQRWHTPDVPRLTRREVVVLKKLINRNLEHVVRFIDYFEGERQSVILTEFLSGGELFQHISSQEYNLTEAKCRDFARQILRAVEFIHSRNIVHLDLKPQNIVLVEKSPHHRRPSTKNSTAAGASTTAASTAAASRGQPRTSTSDANSAADLTPDGVGGGDVSNSVMSSVSTSNGNLVRTEKLKIIDFGLARDLGPDTDRMPINMCGTLEFMSPEVMRCSHASFASDMWSIGVILYMMVSGGLSPFWAGNEYRTQRMILRGQFANGGFNQSNFKDVSPQAIDCISRLLQVDPRQRLTPAQCLEHRWLTTAYLDTLKSLETQWIRKYLARRRWQRWFNTIKAMNRMIHMGHEGHEAGNGANASPFAQVADTSRRQQSYFTRWRSQVQAAPTEMGMEEPTDERWV